VPEASGSWEKYADDNDHKNTARKMVLMMNGINRSYFAGRRVVNCYSCHRGGQLPKVIPNLAEQYGTPPPDDPDEIAAQAPGAPAADAVLNKYIQAIGGAQKLGAVTSVIGKGTYQGYDTENEKRPFDVLVKAPGLRSTIIHMRDGDSATTYDGQSGWISAPKASKPVPQLALTGRDLEGLKVDAEIAFPLRIKDSFSQWRVGPSFTIDDHDVQVVQGTVAGKSIVKLYFDDMTGLLLRVVRYSDTPVGLAPSQVDYSDYRDVNGVKLPFHWIITWVDGKSTVELSTIQINAPIAAAAFAKPAGLAPKPATP
jgi:hypothetical protein